MVNYYFVLPENLCDLHIGHLHTGHGSDRELPFYTENERERERERETERDRENTIIQ